MNIIPLEALDLSCMSCGWGLATANMTILDRPLCVAGTTYAQGVGTHAYSELIVNVGRQALRFEALVGIDDEAGKHGTANFQIWADGRLLAESGYIERGEPARPLTADLTGARKVTLLVLDERRSCHWAHADWLNARFIMCADAPATLECDRFEPQPPPDIREPAQAPPRLHGPVLVGATPGKPFHFLIGATGQGPLRFHARNLPAGLELDAQRGVLRGRLERKGRTLVQLEVSGPAGTAQRALTIVAGPRALALTPPMGWNSWNCWGLAVDDAKVRAAADALLATGLAARGFHYVNIDDGWEAGRAPDGTILCNEKFPDMRALGEYLHERGLKFGIYSSPGPSTCGGFTGSYRHEEQDAQTYAAWGVDFLKYDWCSYEKIAKYRSLPELQKPYRVMAAALAAQPRDIVYSLCQYGMGDVWEWGADVGGNLWRTTGDITDTWSSMMGIGFSHGPRAQYAGPGHWNDPDMLVVGHLGWGPKLHPTHLTGDEQMLHLSLWSLLAAPLLIGCDLTRLDEFTLALLTNDEVLAIDQDPLGIPATCRCADGAVEVWARPLHDGTLAVGMFNRALRPAEMTVTWDALGVTGPCCVRDVWYHKDLGTYQTRYCAEVAAHGAALVVVTPEPRA
jgi:alpha-galactosidase